MVQMFGQPYDPTSLKTIPPSEDASSNRVSYYFTFQDVSFLFLNLFLQNFSVCTNCSRLAQLYHRLAHQKHRMFAMCSEVVETRRKSAVNFDTTKLLNELLANDKWLEQVRNVSCLIDTYLKSY